MTEPGRAATRAIAWELTPEEAAFRERARAWVEREVRAPYLDGLDERSATAFFGIEPQFSRRLGEAGLLGVTTPREHGGAGRSHVEAALLQSELAWHDAPILGHFVAEHEVLPALLRSGTAEQRERWVPELLAGRTLCSQCFTEPGAGSDLAAVATTATPLAGGGFVLRGEKWLNSVAHVAGALWIIARTGPAPRHRGLSMLLVPTATPGIGIVPLAEMTGARRLNRIVFDDVEVGADCLVGELHGGWQVAMDTVARERAGAARPARVRRLIADLAALVPPGSDRPLGDDEAASLALAELAVRAEACELLWHRYARETDRGVQQPDLAGTTLKVYADAVEQELADVATTLLGRFGALDAGASGAPLAGRVARLHLAAPGLSLGGGTSEVLKTVIATRGLGLPRAGAAR